MLLSELEQDSGLRTPSPPSLSSTTPPPPSLPFSSSSPSCKSPPPPSYSTSPREALQFPHLILSGTSPKELPAPSLNTSSPPPQLHCLTTNAGKKFLKIFSLHNFFRWSSWFCPTVTAATHFVSYRFFITYGLSTNWKQCSDHCRPHCLSSQVSVFSSHLNSTWISQRVHLSLLSASGIITLFHFFTFHQIIITLFHFFTFHF